MTRTPDPYTTRFTLSEAAKLTRVSRSSVRRMLDAGKFPTAVRMDDAGNPDLTAPWRVPLSDLLAAGLTIDTAADSSQTPMNEHPTTGEQFPAADVAHLVQELAAAQARADAIDRERDALARELAAERRVNEALLVAVRALEAGRPVPTPQWTAENTPEPDIQTPQAEEGNAADGVSAPQNIDPSPAVIDNAGKDQQRRGFWGWLRDL
jgi:hypothetical protein